MRFNLFRTFRILLTIHRIRISNYKRFLLSDIRQNIARNIAISCGTASITTIVTENNETKVQESGADLGFLKEVRKACIRNDDALKELMDVLSECLIEISKEYQANIDKQIEIIKKCTTLGPLGEHWDELTRYRIQGTELREELTKYEVLVQKVGQMAYNQAVTSLLSGIEDAMDLLEVHYSKLEKTVTKLAKDNYYWETKLLYANRDSILHGLK